MNSFYFDLKDGETILVEYMAVDEDERGDIEFDFTVYNEAGKDYWNDISEEDREKIQAQACIDWEQYIIDERKQIAADQWEARNDGY